MSISDDHSVESARRNIDTENLYLLVKGTEVVSMAMIAHRSGKFGLINFVYTPNKYRKNGYASDLVAMLTKMVLDEGRIPMLYTNDSNNTSNKFI